MKIISVKPCLLLAALLCTSCPLKAETDLNNCLIDPLLTELNATNTRDKKIELARTIFFCVKSSPHVRSTINNKTLTSLSQHLINNDVELVELIGNSLGELGEQAKPALPKLYGAFIRINNLEDSIGSFYSPDLKLIEAMIKIENKNIILQDQHITDRKSE